MKYFFSFLGVSGFFGVCETGVYVGVSLIGHNPINPEGLAGKKPKVVHIPKKGLSGGL